MFTLFLLTIIILLVAYIFKGKIWQKMTSIDVYDAAKVIEKGKQNAIKNKKVDEQHIEYYLGICRQRILEGVNNGQDVIRIPLHGLFFGIKKWNDFNDSSNINLTLQKLLEKEGYKAEYMIEMWGFDIPCFHFNFRHSGGIKVTF